MLTRVSGLRFAEIYYPINIRIECGVEGPLTLLAISEFWVICCTSSPIQSPLLTPGIILKILSWSLSDDVEWYIRPNISLYSVAGEKGEIIGK